ncbi:glycosyltransferase [Amycolatopsis cihanbeyliensis]|uniref:glycosyltransferase n=1 Tax=Amycolatopsis cihanbeyliensis TaxID=1128664 RepID=UPI001B85D37F|nr:glycosyltransferase [Amycolatopsis cihanbeyliensis]
MAQPTTGGVARYVAAAAADQRRRGWDVLVACPEGGMLADALEARAVPRLPWSAARAPGRATAAETARLAGIVATARPDTVHLHSAKAGLAGRLAVRGRLPTLFQPHGWSWLAANGTLAHASTGWERLACRWTHRLLCVGEGEAVQGRAAGIGMPLTVVRNGVDLDEFAPAGRPPRRPGGPTALCPGRLTRQKGQDVLLAAWPLVRRRCPGARLVLLGDGELAGELRARRMPGVEFVPEVTDVRPWYAAADVVVLPSRWEGLSLTALEAFASGRCVVGNDVPGLAELLDDRCGERVRAGDAAALATAVADRLDDLPRARAEGDAARVHAKEFDLRATFDLLAEVTAEVSGWTGGTR